MRVKGQTLQQFILGAALLFAVAWNLAHAGEIKGLALEQGATGTRAELLLDGPAQFTTLSLSGPDRLVVDLPATSLARNLRLPASAGIVKSIRTGQPTPGSVRVVFDLAAPVVALKPRIESSPGGARLVLEWPGDGSVATAVPVAAPQPAAMATVPQASDDPAAASAAATARLVASLPTTPTSASTIQAAPRAIAPQAPRSDLGPPATVPGLPQVVPPVVQSRSVDVISPGPTVAPPGATKSMQQLMRGGMRPLVIAVDAGHGGQDPGARGASGSREKDLTLQIARALARQINATPGLRAYLTRDSDMFIPLAQRYQKARAAKADLFVSIHADAFTNPAASGSSVFVLSQRGASSQAARWLASQENAADLVGGVRLQGKDNTLASVLLDLSQSATMKASEDMAGHVLSGLKRLGKTHKPHVERANFVVLRAPDVPSMLVETAFITNPDEERRLNDPRHQEQLARAILDGVNAYFTRQPPPGTMYAARAEAAMNATAARGAGGSP